VLSNPVMGVLALAILWVNTLLVSADVARQARALLRRRGAMRPARGRVTRGALAVRRVEQVGRAGSAEGTILFHDRGASGEVLGGTLEQEGGEEIEVEASPSAEVWLTAAELERAAACASAEAFDDAYASARKARGFSRTVTATVGAGQEVFVVRGEGGALLVATMDPRGLLARKAALAAAFIAGALVLAAGCTAVALWPPVFGTVSTLGGALCLGFFLLVQPAGTALRDAVLVPSLAPLRGRWTRAELTAGQRQAGLTRAPQ
jgi:hypothetical protein